MHVLRWMILAIGMIGGALGFSMTAGSAPLPASTVVAGGDTALTSQVRWRRHHRYRRGYGRRLYGYRRRGYGFRRAYYRRPFAFRRGYGYRRGYGWRRGYRWRRPAFRRGYGYRRAYGIRRSYGFRPYYY